MPAGQPDADIVTADATARTAGLSAVGRSEPALCTMRLAHQELAGDAHVDMVPRQRFTVPILSVGPSGRVQTNVGKGLPPEVRPKLLRPTVKPTAQANSALNDLRQPAVASGECGLQVTCP